MSFGILSAILGAVLLAGIVFYRKPKAIHAKEHPLTFTYRRGIEVLSVILKWGIPLFLIVSGIYYYRQQSEAAALERREYRKELARRVHLRQLLGILHAPMNEREMKVLEMDLDPKGTNEFGKVYRRDPDDLAVELFETGVVRLLCTNKKDYLRVFDEAKQAGFIFEKETSNNRNDKFSDYRHGSVSCSFGYFTSSQQYCIAISDDSSKIPPPPPFLPVAYLSGAWGRVSVLHNGKYTFEADGTFIFEENFYGMIKGNWRTEDQKIILNYGRSLSDLATDHPLSMSTEIIHVKSKQANQVDGYLNNEIESITLSRQ